MGQNATRNPSRTNWASSEKWLVEIQTIILLLELPRLLQVHPKKRRAEDSAKSTPSKKKKKVVDEEDDSSEEARHLAEVRNEIKNL